MIHNYPKILYHFLFLCFLAACNKNEPINPTLLLSPDNLYIESSAGSVVSFQITCKGNELKRLYVKARPDNSLQSTVFDTLITGNSFMLSYDYKVPAIVQANNILIEIIVVDALGNQANAVRKIMVNKFPIILNESTGHQIFSAVSGKKSGFDLLSLTSVFPNQVGSGQVSLKDVSVLDTNGNFLLSRKWISNASFKFIKFNDFDYANATFESLKQSYESGIASNEVINLAEGDIILTKDPSAASDSGYFAIKLIYVIDQDSTSFDSYIFNIKK